MPIRTCVADIIQYSTRTVSDVRYLYHMSACFSEGPSGLVCAETLRQNGFQGRVVMATKDRYLPYDRTKLSKVWHFVIRNNTAKINIQQ